MADKTFKDKITAKGTEMRVPPKGSPDEFISLTDKPKSNHKDELTKEEIKKAQETFKRREKMLSALNQMSVMLLSHENETFTDTMNNGLKPITDTAGVDRIAVYKRLGQDETRFGQIYLWKGQTIPLEEELVILPEIPPIFRWLEVLREGGDINKDVSKVPEDEAEFLDFYGVKGIYFVPIFMKEDFWGVVTLEDHTTYRTFDEDCLDLLQSAARLCSSVIIRNEMVQQIHDTSARLESALAYAEEQQQIITEEHRKLQIILDMLPVGVRIKRTRDRVLVYANEAFLRIFNFDSFEDQVEGNSGLDFMPEIQPDGRKTVDIIDECSQKDRFFLELQCLKWGGEPFTARFSSCAINYQGERASLAVVEDVTAEREHQQTLEKIAEKEREANKSKSNFLSNMSHEMRTPLNAIIGMTAIGKKADSIEQKNIALKKIGDASSHLLGVINDVLDMSKIEANKLDLAPIEYNFDKMLQNVLTVVNFKKDEKQQNLTVNVDKKIPRFLIGDEQRLAQIIANLLSNAVKFTPEKGEIRLDADLLSEIDGDCEIRIEVADTGIGISAEHHEKLFGAFEQTDSGTSRVYGGTGLGLAISKRIVELMGGTIWIESELGRGAKFIFTIKVRRGSKNPRTMLTPGINWANVKILAVDDEAETRSYLQDIFAQFGLQCDVAADGYEACRMIEEQGTYDIYFIDWFMPGMDGIELTKRIKDNTRYRQSIVIMITAMDWERIREEALNAGVDRCLVKPLLSSMLIDCVNDCFGMDDAKKFEPDNDATGEFAGKKLLISEDVEINREIIMALLKDTGLVFDCAENGKEALDRIEADSDKYDIVFMDMQMPEMDGLEATRRIRALPGHKRENLPIIAMTANVFSSDIEQCLDAGMDDHLGKPLDIDKVLEKLRMYLK